jgi:hypothetical protein
LSRALFNDKTTVTVEKREISERKRGGEEERRRRGEKKGREEGKKGEELGKRAGETQATYSSSKSSSSAPLAVNNKQSCLVFQNSTAANKNLLVSAASKKLFTIILTNV